MIELFYLSFLYFDSILVSQFVEMVLCTYILNCQAQIDHLNNLAKINSF